MNILIADDQPTNLKLLHAQLEAEGHAIFVAHDGLDALAVLECQRIDMVISDILMPRMDGYRLCHEIRKSDRLRDLPFIIYTATYTSPADEKLALDLGADRYLKKPVSVECMIATLNEVIGSPRAARQPVEVQEVGLLKEYSERLVAKLEEKNIDLEQANAELRATRDQLAHLLEHSPAVIYSLKVERDRVVPHVVSENITRLLGYTVEESCSFDWWVTHLHPEDRERALAGIPETIKHGVLNTEYRIQHKDGRYVWVEDNRRLVSDAAGKPTDIVGVWTDITERKRVEAELERAHKELLESSRQAGMADVATGVLHNVGNVLNSVNVASTCLADSLRKSKTGNLSKVVALLREHETDLGPFLTTNQQGKQIPAYLSQLAEHLGGEQVAALHELAELQKNIEHIRDIVTMQQSFAKVSGMVEMLSATDLVEDALRMNASGLARHDIQVVKEFGEVPLIAVEKHKLLQILVNLVRNAMQACDDSGRSENKLTVRTTRLNGHVRIEVSDNGVGISPENLSRIFSHGFTTKKDGHGFGLHNSALGAKEMGGSLSVQSGGFGQGATFTLELPCPTQDVLKRN